MTSAERVPSVARVFHAEADEIRSLSIQFVAEEARGERTPKPEVKHPALIPLSYVLGKKSKSPFVTVFYSL